MIKRSVFTILIMLFSLNLQAQLKVGYTSPNRILAQIDEVDQVDEKIKKLIAERDYELTTKAEKLEKEFADYERIRGTLTESRREMMEEELLTKNNIFEEERENYLTEIRQKQSELMQPVFEMIENAIREVAQNMDLDLVLNQGTSNGDLIVFFASENRFDITQDVINVLNAQ